MTIGGNMATKTWNCTADWFTAGDWNGGTLPAAGDDDVIATGAVSLVTGDAAISADSLTVNSGAEFSDTDSGHTDTNPPRH
jgi:hypothetical protein